MLAKIIRDDIEISLPHLGPGHEDQWEYRNVMRNDEIVAVPFWKVGAIVNMPDCYMLVRIGVAIPADDACFQRAHRTPEQQAAAQKSYSRIAKGLHPEDFELFDAGVITGYKPDGSYAPGPKWDEYQKQLEAAQPADHEEEDEDQ